MSDPNLKQFFKLAVQLATKTSDVHKTSVCIKDGEYACITSYIKLSEFKTKKEPINTNKVEKPTNTNIKDDTQSTFFNIYSSANQSDEPVLIYDNGSIRVTKTCEIVHFRSRGNKFKISLNLDNFMKRVFPKIFMGKITDPIHLAYKFVLDNLYYTALDMYHIPCSVTTKDGHYAMWHGGQILSTDKLFGTLVEKFINKHNETIKILNNLIEKSCE